MCGWGAYSCAQCASVRTHMHTHRPPAWRCRGVRTSQHPARRRPPRSAPSAARPWPGPGCPAGGSPGWGVGWVGGVWVGWEVGGGWPGGVSSCAHASGWHLATPCTRARRTRSSGPPPSPSTWRAPRSRPGPALPPAPTRRAPRATVRAAPCLLLADGLAGWLAGWLAGPESREIRTEKTDAGSTGFKAGPPRRGKHEPIRPFPNQRRTASRPSRQRNRPP